MNALYWNLVSGFYNRSFACGRGSVAVEPLLIYRLNLVTSSEKPANRDHLRKGCKSADVVGVVVADNKVINLLQTGLFSRRIDSFGIAVIVRRAGLGRRRAG